MHRFYSVFRFGSGEMVLRENSAGHTRLGCIDFAGNFIGNVHAGIYEVIFINSKLLVVTCAVGIYFVSLPWFRYGGVQGANLDFPCI